MKRLLFLATLCLALFGCGYPAHIDPPLFTYDTVTLTRLSAEARARDIGGIVYIVADTHSMEPLLRGGDFIVVDTRVPYDAVKKGQVITYHAQWRAPTDAPVTHRVVLKDGYGLLVDGDNVHPDIDPKTGRDLHSEASWRVTPKEYVGAVDGIYRTKS